jgi:hypothetical protein
MLKSSVIYTVDLPLCSFFSNTIHLDHLSGFSEIILFQMNRQSWVQNAQEVSEERVFK